MKKYIFFTLLFLVTGFSAYAEKQKVTVDGDTILVNDKPYGIIEKERGADMGFTVRSMDGKEQINFKQFQFNDPTEINSANPKGTVSYFAVTFMVSGNKCEIRAVATKKNMAKAIVDNNLLTPTGVDAEAERRYILLNGSKYSERQKALGAPTIIIVR